MKGRLEDEVDRLFQLPLDEFTAARNALAKAYGKSGDAVRELRKPPTAVWAVNQVYWRRRDLYTSLIDAAQALRAAHAAILSGKKADVRAAGQAHDAALQGALESALGFLAEAGQPATDATKQAIATTLRALPSGESPGRLTHALEPGGFEVLAGIPVAPLRAGDPPAPKPAPRKTHTPEAEPRPVPPKRGAQAEELVRARKEAAAAAEAVRQAERTAKREELEAARTAREREKAERAAGVAQRALDSARQALAGAERAHEAAASRAREAEEALAEARRGAKSAAEALDALT
jgi:hypothetical protein